MLDKARRKEISRIANARHYLTPYRHHWKKAESCAKKKNIEFLLTYEEFLNFVKIKECFYCNFPIRWEPFGNKVYGYNLDRKDNKIGYRKDNLVVCCWKCNDLKGNRISFEDFCIFSQIVLKDRFKNHWLIDKLPNSFMSLNGFDY